MSQYPMFFNETLVLEEWGWNKTRMSKRGAISLIDKMSLQRIYNTTCTAEKEIRSDEETRQATDFRSQCHKENVRGNKLRKLFRRLGTGLANASEKLSPCRDTEQFYSVYRGGKSFRGGQQVGEVSLWPRWQCLVNGPWGVSKSVERLILRLAEPRYETIRGKFSRILLVEKRHRFHGIGVKWIVLVLPINYITIFLTGHFLTFEIIRFEDKRKITDVWV